MPSRTFSRGLLEHLRPGAVFFDVGAHFGWHSLKAARRLGQGGRVVAFEASPTLLEIVRYHQRRNRLPQMMVVGKAASETDSGAAPFYLLNGELCPRNSLTIGQPDVPLLRSAKKTAVAVPTVALDTFCRSQNLYPDVIKIDVEGAELLVLRGASAVLREHRPVLIVSTHPYWLPESQSVDEIFEFLAGHGYEVRDSHVMQLEGYTVGDYLLTPKPDSGVKTW